MRYNFIAIEGNIGSGKTSFAEKLARDCKGRLLLERFADNPFLSKFYANPRQYAFTLELSFMAERYQQMKSLVAERDLFSDLVVSDYLFVKSLLFANITLEEDENLLYRKLFDIMYPNVAQPQLIVYLHNEVRNVLKNIAKRGRPYEQNITADYLEKIQHAYLQYFKSITKQTVLVIDVSKLDFVESERDYQKVVELTDLDFTPGTHFIAL